MSEESQQGVVAKEEEVVVVEKSPAPIKQASPVKQAVSHVGLSPELVMRLEMGIAEMNMGMARIEKAIQEEVGKEECYNSEEVVRQITAMVAELPEDVEKTVLDVLRKYTTGPEILDVVVGAMLATAVAAILVYLKEDFLGFGNKHIKAMSEGFGSLEKGIVDLKDGMDDLKGGMDEGFRDVKDTMREGFGMRPSGEMDIDIDLRKGRRGRKMDIDLPDDRGDVDRGKGSASSGRADEAEGGKASRKTGLSALGAKGVAKIVGKAALRLVPGIGQALLVADIASMAVGMAGHVQGMIEAKKKPSDTGEWGLGVFGGCVECLTE